MKNVFSLSFAGLLVKTYMTISVSWAKADKTYKQLQKMSGNKKPVATPLGSLLKGA